MEWITNPEIWISLVTVTVLEIVLGIDNIVFISILSGKLPEDQQAKARRLGLGLAMITRVLLLLSISYIMKLTVPLFEIFNHEVTGKALILGVGGLFLVYKSIKEIHEKMEGDEHDENEKKKKLSFSSVIIQILILDIVFSLDSVITAVGMADEVWVMIAAVIIAVLIMMFSADSVSKFVNKHPTVKMLALSFLILIGVSLMAESFDRGIPKQYIYFAMAFSVLVEMLNLRAKKKSQPIKLREPNRP